MTEYFARPALSPPSHPAWRLVATCGALTWKGARVRAVRLIPQPVIVIAPPSLALLAKLGGRNTPRGGMTHWRGVRITWDTAGYRRDRP